MVSFPNAKINIGLYITGKRPDGYHDLQSVFFPVQIHDAIEVVHAKEVFPDNILLSTSGSKVDADNNNLCYKAYQLLKHDHPQLPSVEMHLLKNIPMGAGLGGGSADGAFMLQLLNKVFNLGLGEKQLIEYALALGSDCPFFIYNKPCFVSGRGEKLERIPVDLSPYKILIVNPGIHVSTSWAFSQIKPDSGDNNLYRNIIQPVEKWHTTIGNDFETPVFTAFPAIRILKETLYEMGAIYASMSGSGSTVFGIFEKNKQPDLSFPDEYFHMWG